MSFDQIIAFCIFAVIASITPGPNNMMMLASGLNYGFIRSLPHLAGISIGFAFMVFATGFGLHAVFVQIPTLQIVLKYGGAIYLLWLAWQLAHAAPLSSGTPNASRPITFLEAAAFQWVNPKAWVMAVGALTTYLPQSFGLFNVGVMAFLFGIITIPCVGVWNAFGLAMRRVLKSPRSVRIFNLVMAVLLVISLYPVFAE